jgi:hypothetical protein
VLFGGRPVPVVHAQRKLHSDDLKRMDQLYYKPKSPANMTRLPKHIDCQHDLLADLLPVELPADLLNQSGGFDVAAMCR